MEPSLSSTSLTKRSLLPTKALANSASGRTKFFITAPFITVGSRPRSERIQPIMPVVVDLPDVPPTATETGAEFTSSANSSGRFSIFAPSRLAETMSGTVSYVRTVSPDCRAIAVDTQASVLFGPPDGHRELRGLGMSVIPANLDYRVLDDLHWVSASLAYAATRRLHRQHALFMGPTSGAAFQVANWHATNNPDSMTVVMMPDEGYRYLDTVYDDEWLQANGHGAPADPADPVATTDSTRPPVPWSSFRWDRRSHAEVVSGHEPAATR